MTDVSASLSRAPSAMFGHGAPWTSASSTPFRARLHTTMASAEPVWRRLQVEGASTVYQRFDWVAAVVAHLAPSKSAQLAIVEVLDGASGRSLLLFPLALRRINGVRTLEWLNFGVCDYVAPIMALDVNLTPSEAEQAWRSAKAALPSADLIKFGNISTHMFGRANPLAMLKRAHRADLEAFGLVLEGDPATLIERTCKSSFVVDQRRRMRQFTKFPDFRFFVASAKAEVEEVYNVLVDQRRKRFSDLGRFDILNQAEYVAFYRAAARDGLNGGPVRLVAVQADGELAATALVLVHNGAFNVILLAIGDAKWRGLSPGLFLLGEAMKWARAQGLTYFDLTVGSLPYKERLGARGQKLLQYSEALSWRGAFVLFGERLMEAALARLKANKFAYDRARKFVQRYRKFRARRDTQHG